MSVSLLTNITSMAVAGHLEKSAAELAKISERLASGRRINRAGDDAAGLAISDTLEAKIRSATTAKRNAQDALSMIQVIEGGMNEANNLTIRLRELAMQAASDGIGDSERQMLEIEANQIMLEVDRIAHSTTFLGTKLLNGGSKQFSFQIGIENTDYDRIEYDTADVNITTRAVGLSGLSLAEKSSAQEALGKVDEAIKKLVFPRAKVGAFQTRLHSTINSMNTYEENLISAKSRIVDADLARESARFVQADVLQKAGISVLMQANSLPLNALKLVMSVMS